MGNGIHLNTSSILVAWSVKEECTKASSLSLKTLYSAKNSAISNYILSGTPMPNKRIALRITTAVLRDKSTLKATAAEFSSLRILTC